MVAHPDFATRDLSSVRGISSVPHRWPSS